MISQPMCSCNFLNHKQGDDDKPALRERILSCNNKLTAADIVFKEALKIFRNKSIGIY